MNAVIFLIPDFGTPEGRRRDKTTITIMFVIVVALMFVAMPVAAWMAP